MKSLNSFTGLPISKGMLLLPTQEQKVVVEKALLEYVEVEGYDKYIDIVPLMRYLNEKLDFKGDDIKIALCAIASENNVKYNLKIIFEGNLNATQKKILPLFDKYFRSHIQVKSEETIQKEKEDTEMLLENVEPFEVSLDK